MGLYPPIVASSMPAFDIAKGKVRIYFTLSNYNSNKIEDIQAVHITCRRQNSNVNVLDNNTLIIQKIPQQDDIDKAFHRYFILLENKDIKEGFKIDVLYKVQLRFSSIYDASATVSFYTNNIEKFSEWSTVCIIKAIKAPLFYIDEFHVEGEKPKEEDINDFNYNLADFVGVFKEGEESSLTLKSWRLRLLSSNYSKDLILNIDSYTLADSGLQISSAYNYVINNTSIILECSLPYLLQENSLYKLLFEITTKNDYHDYILYQFQYSPQNIGMLNGELNTYVNEEEGYIKIKYTSEEYYMGNLVLRRTDAKSNFLKWEDIKNFESHDVNNFNYYDFTAESGMIYRYLVQKRDARGRRGTPVYSQAYTIAEWENAFLLLSADGTDISNIKQLKLKFDFQISSYTTNISESKTDTIGSKYPYIRRNGNMYYRSFPCTGTITGFMDNANLFTSEEELFYNNVKYYTLFEGQKNKAEFFWQEFQGNNLTIVSLKKEDPHILYTREYDYTYERRFREVVQDFLYNAKPKLYKSTQEGNIFVKLMDISLTPKQLLGRLIYTFSATAYEIDLPTIDTFNSYGLINVGNYNPHVSYSEERIGQLTSFISEKNPLGNIFKGGCDIIGASSNAAANSIARQQKYKLPFNNKVVTDFELTYLRITVESDPYLIVYRNNKFVPLDDTPLENYNEENDPFNPGKITHKLYQMESTYDNLDVYLGTLFEINGKQIIIAPPNNIYELKDDGLHLKGQRTSIIPAKDTVMTVDYVINLLIEEDTSKVPKFIRVDNTNGQLLGTFSYLDELINRINYQYRYSFTDDNDKIQKFVNGVKTILVDTEPGVVIKAQTSSDEYGDLHRFIINLTGELFFDPGDSRINITKMFIYGINIPTSKLKNRGNFNSLDLVLYPIDKDMCIVGNKIYIYYKNNWYLAEGQDLLENNNDNIQQKIYYSYDIKCPIDALIFYYAAVERRFY